MLSNATNHQKSTVELGYMCPRGQFLHMMNIYISPENQINDL